MPNNIINIKRKNCHVSFLHALAVTRKMQISATKNYIKLESTDRDKLLLK